MEPQIVAARKMIRRAVDEYGPTAAACSFGKDSLVLVHLCLQEDPNFPLFAVTTPFKPKETIDYKGFLTSLWSLNVKTYKSDRPVSDTIYKTDPDECCKVFKVEPTKRAIKELGLKSWISGVRRTEGITRTNFDFFEEYEGGITKVNPILDWTEVDIWRYIARYNLPVNPLYFQGYRSLGCAPCSKPYTEEERGGRWSGTAKHGGECGIHSKMFKRKK
tara:strand:+ start:73 stop:726 length:654 start_codon:yes stop_codon:yes gene_type:complete